MSNGGGQGGIGQMLPPHNNSEFNRTAFQSQMMKARLRTMIPVRVVKVYKQDGMTVAQRGDVAGAGFVDVQPMVSQVDGGGTRMDHLTVYHLPYTRIYGGDFAVICDPVVGDVGYAHCADRDISAFKDQIKQGSTQPVLPGSARRHDMADALYVGGVLNNAPKQYITATDKGVTINDVNGNMIVMDKNGITLTPGSGGKIFLGGSDASKKVAFEGTIDSSGDTLVSNFATKVVAK